MRLTKPEREFIKFIIDNPSYFKRDALDYLNKTEFERVLIENNLSLFDLLEMFKGLIKRRLFVYDLIFNCEALRFKRHFCFLSTPIRSSSPLLICQLNMYPIYLNVFALPQDNSFKNRFQDELYRDFGQEAKLIPVEPVVFLRKGRWSRIYYDLAHLTKTEFRLMRELNKWSHPSQNNKKQSIQPFQELGVLPDQISLKKLDLILDRAKASVEYTLEISPFLEKMKDTRVLEDIIDIDLREGQRWFFRIQRPTGNPEGQDAKQVIARVLQNCFCVEAYLSENEIFIDLRTLINDRFFTLVAKKNLPFVLSCHHIVDEYWPCKLHKAKSVK